MVRKFSPVTRWMLRTCSRPPSTPRDTTVSFSCETLNSPQRANTISNRSEVAHVAYIPVKRIVGISKLARILELHARRLQNQERITQGIADDLERELQPLGAAVIIEAAHGCMQCRGVAKQQAVMTTSAMRGVFFDRPEARAELMQLIQQPKL